jgi:hypothetical protein
MGGNRDWLTNSQCIGKCSLSGHIPATIAAARGRLPGSQLAEKFLRSPANDGDLIAAFFISQSSQQASPRFRRE